MLHITSQGDEYFFFMYNAGHKVARSFCIFIRVVRSAVYEKPLDLGVPTQFLDKRVKKIDMDNNQTRTPYGILPGSKKGKRVRTLQPLLPLLYASTGNPSATVGQVKECRAVLIDNCP